MNVGADIVRARIARMHFTEYDTRLAAYAVIVRDDAILLSWFNGSNPGWTLPGGGVEFDESIEEAVVRELFEETGYRVDVGAPLTTHSFSVAGDGRGRPFKSVRILFDATITGGELGTTEVDGTTDFAQWVPLAEIDDSGARVGIVDIALDLVAEMER